MPRYTTRLNQKENMAIFVSPPPLDHSTVLQKIVLNQRSIYERYVKPSQHLPENPASDQDLANIETQLDFYVNDSFFVALEMFLYSVKCVEGLLPDDHPESPMPNDAQRELETYYLGFLETLIQKMLGFTEDGSSNSEAVRADFQGRYLHILKSWPDSGTWRMAKRLAILLYPRIPLEMEEAGQVIAEKYLYDPDLWRVSYQVLSSPAQDSFASWQIQALVSFMLSYGESSRNEEHFRIFNQLLPNFTQLMQTVSEAYPDIWEEVSELVAEREVPSRLRRCLGVDLDDPLASVRDKPESFQCNYVQANFDPYNAAWNQWLRNLHDPKLFEAVEQWYRTSAYQPMDYRRTYKFLTYLNQIRDPEHKASLMNKICQSGEMPPRNAEEKFAQKCALFLGRMGNISPEELYELYESMTPDQRSHMRSTFGNLINFNNAFYSAFYVHLRELKDEIMASDEQEALKLLGIFKDYAMINQIKYKAGLFPKEELYSCLCYCCGFDPAQKYFTLTPSSRILQISVELVGAIMERSNREKYKDFLYAVRDTSQRALAETLLLTYFRDEGENQ